MNKKVLLFLATALLFINCNQQKKEKIDSASIKIEGVVLNNGTLWKANKETTDGIAAMKKTIASFSKNADVESYTSLKETLENQFTQIFSRCTMKGEAHEQLHNYLKPMISYFDGLTSKDKKERKENLHQLEKHVLGYSNYFN